MIKLYISLSVTNNVSYAITFASNSPLSKCLQLASELNPFQDGLFLRIGFLFLDYFLKLFDYIYLVRHIGVCVHIE